MYDPAELLAERGLTPAQVIDLKGFMGDTSDNYPGVKGIGEKTATKLLTEYGTVEGVIENLHLLPKGVRAKIEADLDMLHLSRELAEIRCDVPVVCELAECLWELQRDTAARKFQELEFGSLMHLIGGIAEVRDDRGSCRLSWGIWAEAGIDSKQIKTADAHLS